MANDLFAKIILADNEIDRSFNLLAPEVIKQVEAAMKALENNNIGIIDKVIARDDYIDNLKSTIENKCFNSISVPGLDKKAINVIRAVVIITANLEHIADHAVNIVSQVKYFKTNNFIEKYEYRKFFAEILKAMDIINTALFSRNIPKAFEICKVEYTLDILFTRNFKKIISALKRGGDTENLVTTLFILRYLERMGDAMLNIGEAVLLAILGHKLKIHDFEIMEDSLHVNNLQDMLAGFDIYPITNTKSGCKIMHIHENEEARDTKKQAEDMGVIIKHGNLAKITKECENIKLWEKIMPGLPPKIIEFQKRENSAFMLLQYLSGITFQQIVFDCDNTLLFDSLHRLFDLIQDIWRKTKQYEPVNAFFVKQIIERTDDIYKIHPYFDTAEQKICSLSTQPFRLLIDMASERESGLNAPFSVLIHGDFNIDNIIYNKEQKSFHYVDFYRSRRQDYVQDASIFLVSNFRQPLFKKGMRERLNSVISNFYFFALRFAEQNNDDTFDARMALGLARSFITSTRFEIDRHFAVEMHKRAVYLLEKIINFGGDWRSFSLPIEILFY